MKVKRKSGEKERTGENTGKEREEGEKKNSEWKRRDGE